MKHPFVPLLLAFASLTTSLTALAADFEYPELAVAPRASERVETEAARESQERWTHLAIQAPAAMTMVSGITLFASGTDDSPEKTWPKYAPWVGIGVGAAWIGLTEWALKKNPPYAIAAKDLAGLPKKTTREQLVRERRAEEALENGASIARKMKYFSFLTNVGASVYMASAAKEGSFGRTFAIASAFTALTPLLFAHPWEKTADFQRDYKKRIYGPVASVGLLQRNSRGDVSPGLVLALRW